MEKAKRKSRFVTKDDGKPFRITELDLQALDLLQRYSYLPSTYFNPLLGWEGSNFQDLLYKLRNRAKLIDCPDASWAAANSRYRPAVYALTRKGEQFLKDRGLWKGRKKGGVFNHELMVCLIQASFEIGAKEHGLELITAQQILDHPKCPRERSTQATNPWTVPVEFELNGYDISREVESDGAFFGLAHYHGADRVAIMFPGFEADRRTEPLEPEDYERSGIQIKFAQYRAIAQQKLYQQRYGLPNAIVPFITISEDHKRALMGVLDRLTNGRGSKLFIFKSIPNFASFESFPAPTGHMISEPWERVGHPPYSILEELKGGA